MGLSDVRKPALEWSEAAMLPAQVRTLSGGAALKMLPVGESLRTLEGIEERQTPAPAPDAAIERMRALRRAAYRAVREGDQRAKIWVTYTNPLSS